MLAGRSRVDLLHTLHGAAVTIEAEAARLRIASASAEYGAIGVQLTSRSLARERTARDIVAHPRGCALARDIGQRIGESRE